MKKKYIPDLTEIAALCESNFHKLQQLLPEFDQLDDHGFVLRGLSEQLQKINIEITERFAYTTTLEITQETPLQDWISPPSMMVRMYHDANMAEVVSFANNHRIQGVYQYPNPKMHLPNEKHQLNLFLGEWLNHCLAHGESDIQIGPLASFIST